jgi:CheY-like chemotaxis protein
LTTTLLAVDDSKTMRKVLEITFSGEDFRLLLCGSANEALGKLSERPSVALVDAGLEGNGGYELCQKLKAAQPGLGVIILSSKQTPYDRALGGQVGADDFADKPFDTQQLIDKVTTLSKKSAGAPAPAPAPAPQPAAPRMSSTLQYGAGVSAAPAAAPVPAPVAAQPIGGVSRQTTPGLAAGQSFASRAPAAAASAAPAAELRAAPTPPTAPIAIAPSRAPAAAAPATKGADFAQ